MRTVGEILKKRRGEKKLSLDDVEAKIKIRKKYLEALEENSWNRLPSLPYIKGFLKNYASFLDLNPDEILAVFRRQYQYEEETDVMPKGVASPLNKPLIKFTPQTIFLLIGGFFLLIFFVNLSFQYRAIINPPTLSVERPNEGEILSSEVLEVKGKTDSDATVTINNKGITVDDTGQFSETFNLQPGYNTIVIEATSKHGKKKTVTRTVSVGEKSE